MYWCYLVMQSFCLSLSTKSNKLAAQNKCGSLPPVTGSSELISTWTNKQQVTLDASRRLFTSHYPNPRQTKHASSNRSVWPSFQWLFGCINETAMFLGRGGGLWSNLPHMGKAWADIASSGE